MPRTSRPDGRGLALLGAGLVLVLPALAEGGAWTLGRGRLELKQTASWWESDRKFASTLDTQLVFPERGPVSTGERIPFDPVTGGRLQVLGLVTEARLGVTDWLDLGAALPFLWMDFATRPEDTVDSRFGLGDLLLSAQVLGLRRGRLALAGRLEWKIPTGGFDPLVFSVPLTEGQMDVSIVASLGASLFPYGYANVEVGWRFRFENPDNKRDPGDELRFLAEAGVDLPRGLLFKVAVDGLVGQEGALARFGVSTRVPRRRLFTLWTGLLWGVSDRWRIELQARTLLAGEDVPTGVQAFLGFSYAFAVFGGRR